jgi:alkyl hydroperoxide reductase subunit AhpC
MLQLHIHVVQGGLGHLEFPLVADITKSISRDYGVLVEDAADGLNGVALRGTFIIDPKGTVRNIQISDEAVGRSVDEVIRLLQAFQYVEKHGEVCPSDWKPGHKSMKADVVKSHEYFAQLK